MLNTGFVSARMLPTPLSTMTSRCYLPIAAFALSFGSVALAGGPQFVDQTSTRFPSPGFSEWTNQLTVGDLDGDGDLDLVFANGGNFSTAGTPQKLRIFINNGLGFFTDETDARTGGLTFLARGVELGDIERDGDLDIIVAQDFNRQPTLLVNNGVGVFTNETNTRLPIGTFSSTRAQFADVDNDGDLDLYFTNGGNVSRWGSGVGKLWLNNGSGVFTDVTGAQMPPQATSEPQDCIFGDLDGDLDLDLRIGSTAFNQGKIYFNDGNGTFSVGAAPSDNNCYSYDLGDMDGNGSLDMLGANAHPTSGNSELQLFNNGSGAFTQGAFIGAGTDDNDSKFLDIDNDDDLDLIIGSLGSTERVYSNNGAGVFTLVSGAITAVGDSSLDIMVADVNADGRYDIITGQGESGSFLNRIYINNGPADTNPPKIVNVEDLQDTTDPGPYVVRATIFDAISSDRGFFEKSVFVWWRNGGKGKFTRVGMPWSGNSLWRGEIPAQTTGGLIEYYIVARDFAGNIATSPTFSFELTLPCQGDFVSADTFQPPGDGSVDAADLAYLLGEWGRNPGSPADMVSNITFQPPPDGMVDAADLAFLLGAWGTCN
jgi:hypothetical protein